MLLRPCIHRYLVGPTEFILRRKPQHPQVVFADELAEGQAAQRDVLDGPQSRSVVLVVPAAHAAPVGLSAAQVA